MTDYVKREDVLLLIREESSAWKGKGDDVAGALNALEYVADGVRSLPSAPVSEERESAVRAQQAEPCPRCKGTGKIKVTSFADPTLLLDSGCRICKGTGVLAQQAEPVAWLWTIKGENVPCAASLQPGNPHRHISTPLYAAPPAALAGQTNNGHSPPSTAGNTVGQAGLTVGPNFDGEAPTTRAERENVARKLEQCKLDVRAVGNTLAYDGNVTVPTILLQRVLDLLRATPDSEFDA